MKHLQGIGFLLFLLVFVGCGGISDFSRETYRKEFLTSDPITKEAVAALPMTGQIKTLRYLEAARGIFENAMTEMQPAIHPLSFSISPTKEVLEESDFDALKKTTSVRFLLQTELRQVEVVEGATQIRIEGRLWDIEQGSILWEGVGESRGHLFLFFPTAPASFEKAMDVASRGLIQKLPMKKS